METMDQENKKGSGQNLKVHFVDLPQTEAKEAVFVASNHKPTGSSSTNSSSIELETIDEDEDIDSLLNLKQPTLLSQGPMPSPEACPQTPGSSMQSGSSITSSQLQMMGRFPGYDPNRIPASVFSSKPSTPLEWSVASNESLFSLHVGNNSFSRDSFILMPKSGDSNDLFQKSGELMRPDYMSGVSIMPSSVNKRDSFVQRHKSGEVPKSDESVDIPNILPPITEGKILETNDLKSHEAAKITEKPAETLETKNLNFEESPNREKMAPADENRTSTSVSYRSDESYTSGKSFQFPVLAGDGGMSSSTMCVQEQQRPEKEMLQEEQSQPPQTTPKEKEPKTSWFSCFYRCGSFCR